MHHRAGLEVGRMDLGGCATARANNVQQQRWTRFFVGMSMAEQALGM